MPWLHGTSVSRDPIQCFGLTTANELAPALPSQSLGILMQIGVAILLIQSP